MYLSRMAAINGGCAETTPAFNVNRLCGSGLQAIVSASQSILLGDCDIAIGGGAENMSRAPYASLTSRWGMRMGDTKMVDMMLGALHDPFHTIHMGVTAENVAAKYGISRDMQDALSAPLRPGSSKTRSCRSCSKAKKATWLTPPTSTSALVASSKTWPNSSPCS
jgi:acetyl-CoA C-acetyltransferase